MNIGYRIICLNSGALAGNGAGALIKDKSLGTLTATPADTCLADFFFSSFVSKIEEDTRILAVPTEDVDAQQREKTYQVL